MNRQLVNMGRPRHDHQEASCPGPETTRRWGVFQAQPLTRTRQSVAGRRTMTSSSADQCDRPSPTIEMNLDASRSVDRPHIRNRANCQKRLQTSQLAYPKLLKAALQCRLRRRSHIGCMNMQFPHPDGVISVKGAGYWKTVVCGPRMNGM